jgi:hypothetical protein
MPLYTEEVAGDPFSDSDLTFSTSEVLRATASEAFLDAPLLSAIPRAIELDVARKRYGTAYQNFDKTSALGWLEKRGLTEQDLPLEDRQYNELELSILTRRKIAEIQRQRVLQGGEGGAGETAARFGTAIGVSLLDPLNVGSAFIPVVGQARYAAMLARTSGTAGRAAVRLQVGAVEGAAGALLLEPIIAGARFQELADYHATDSLLNIAFGTVFGGGLHTVGGAISDKLSPIPQTITPPAKSARAPDAAEIPTAQQLETAPTSSGADAPPSQPVATEPPPGPARDQFELQVREIETEANRLLDVERARILAAIESPDAAALRLRGDFSETAARAENLRIARDESAATLMQERSAQIDAEALRLSTIDERNALVRRFPGMDPDAILPAIREEAARRIDARRAAAQQQYDAATRGLSIAGEDVRRFNSLSAAESALERIDFERKSAQSVADLLDLLPERAKASLSFRLKEAQAELDALMKFAPDSAYVKAATATEAQRGAALKVAVAQIVEGRPVRVDGALSGDMQQVMRDAESPRAEDNPLADVRAAEQADAELAELPANEAAELAAIKEAIAEATEAAEAFRADLQASGVDDALPADLQAEMQAVKDYEAEIKDTAEIARRAAVCSMRSVA